MEQVNQSLDELKKCTDSGHARRSKMWFHFGPVVIWNVDEGMYASWSCIRQLQGDDRLLTVDKLSLTIDDRRPPWTGGWGVVAREWFGVTVSRLDVDMVGWQSAAHIQFPPYRHSIDDCPWSTAVWHGRILACMVIRAWSHNLTSQMLQFQHTLWDWIKRIHQYKIDTVFYICYSRWAYPFCCSHVNVEDADKEWTVEEATQNLAHTRPGERYPRWRTHLGKKFRIPFDLEARPVHGVRYDVSFVTPSIKILCCRVRTENETTITDQSRLS